MTMEARCIKHPTYGGHNTPRNNCTTCRELFNIRSPRRARSLRQSERGQEAIELTPATVKAIEVVMRQASTTHKEEV